jgi:hypothetical protein
MTRYMQLDRPEYLHIREMFFKTLMGNITIESFELWIYSSQELEKILSEDNYLQLISFNYKTRGAKYELDELLMGIIDKANYEEYRLISLLTDARNKTEQLPYILTRFYDLYCDGYSFLQNLGLGYGLVIGDPTIHGFGEDNWDFLKDGQKAEILESFYPALDMDIDKTPNWLATKQIILSGEIDELGRYEYQDFRSPEEREYWGKVELTPKKKWWQFWLS